jgi:hypothetical protein
MTEQPTEKNETTKPARDSLTATKVSPKAKTKVKFPISLNKYKSTVIGSIFLALGIIALLLSIYVNSQILALIGLGLTFWGALFFLLAPTRYVEGNILTSTAVATYLTLDRLIGDFNYSGQAYYVPPYSQESHLPQHLKGLKEVVAYVSAQKRPAKLQLEEIAHRKFILSNKRGVLIAPPGIGLLDEIEKKIHETTRMNLNDLCEIFPKIMLENFALAKDITIQAEADKVNLTIRDSLYMNLYNPESNLKSIRTLGCPIASAVACAIAKTTGKTVTIENTQVAPEDLTTETEYRLV